MDPRRLFVGTCVLVVVLVMGGCGGDPAETTTHEPVPDSAFVDSLRKALNRFEAAGAPSAEDRAALHRWADSVQERGRSLWRQAPTQGRRLLETSRRAYRQLGDSVGMVVSVGDMGLAHYRQSEYDEARARFREALRLSRDLGLPAEASTNLNNIGLTYERQDRYEAALARYRESLDIKRKIGDREGIGRVLNNIGLVHWNQNEYEQALGRYRAALDIERAAEDRQGIARLLNNIGLIYKDWGRYQEALPRFQESLQIKQDIGNEAGIARTLNNIAIIHKVRGRYEKALVQYRESLAIKREIGNREGIARSLNNIGNVYQRQGRYGKALARYRDALTIRQDIADRKGVSATRNNIGLVYEHRGRYADALQQYQASLSTSRRIGDRSGTASSLTNVGTVREKQGRYGEALARYREALSISRDIGDRESIASALRHMGNVHRREEQLTDALEQYEKALRINRTIGNRPGITNNLRRIGDVYLENGRPSVATDTLVRAVELAEALRLEATSPEARRSLLATQIGSYRALTTAHVRSDQPASALRSLERARARLIGDRLAGVADADTTFQIPSPATLQDVLGPNEAALLYANSGSEQPLVAVGVTRDTIYARELPASTFRRGIERAYSSRLRDVRHVEGRLLSEALSDGVRGGGAAAGLAEGIRLYRHHLVGTDGSPSIRDDLARRLYGLLVEPVMRPLRGTNRLTIIPTGVLGYLPFETLRDSTGRYLVETKQVRYAQSLRVRRQLQRRPEVEFERPLLAIGGADYGSSAGQPDTALLADVRGASAIASEEHASTLLRLARKKLDRGRSPRSAYARLGYAQWSSLPGTKLEVLKLEKAIGPGTRVRTDAEASEAQVRRMSERGTLSRYRWVHFATHGVAVPEAPQLSALVLSQVGASDSLSARDGYLTMTEIANLDLRADVAVLSGCRTGLGRIVAGEGVVSLSHAFLRAGANATLVSQWRVSDWSTQQFMTAVYRQAKEPNTSFVEAVTRVKRDFISGRFGARNTDPMRWAPFVYYGRE